MTTPVAACPFGESCVEIAVSVCNGDLLPEEAPEKIRSCVVHIAHARRAFTNAVQERLVASVTKHDTQDVQMVSATLERAIASLALAKQPGACCMPALLDTMKKTLVELGLEASLDPPAELLASAKPEMAH